jgi:glycosyltransferase 2 family protein
MSTKKIIELLGSLLALLGVIFITFKLISSANQLGFEKFHLTQWIFILALSVMYAMANSFLALAWHALLQKFNLSIDWKWAVYIYGKTQIIKYVPGNIFHLASRQAEGQQAGLPAIPLAKTTMWEIICLASMALPFAPILLTQFGFTIILSGIIALIILGAIGFSWLKAHPLLLKASAYYFVFLLCSGLVFYSLALCFTDISLQDWRLLFIFPAIFIIAWLVGFVTPGAPAGVGVRELTLIFLAKSYLPEAEVLTLTIFSRFVTGFGDVIFFFGTRLFKTTNREL